MPENLIIRRGSPLDLSYIASTWLQSYSTSKTRWHLQDRYYKIWPVIIEQLLRRSESLVATLIDDPDLILGWAVFEPKERLLHYVYVRGKSSQSEGLQHEGIGKALIADLLPNLGEWSCTHQTKMSQDCFIERRRRGLPVPSYQPGALLGEQGVAA